MITYGDLRSAMTRRAHRPCSTCAATPPEEFQRDDRVIALRMGRYAYRGDWRIALIDGPEVLLYDWTSKTVFMTTLDQLRRAP